MYRLLSLGARGARLVCADGGGEKFGRIELGGAGFRRLARVEGFDQRVDHVFSVRPAQGRMCHRADGAVGAAGRLSPLVLSVAYVAIVAPPQGNCPANPAWGATRPGCISPVP